MKIRHAIIAGTIAAAPLGLTALPASAATPPITLHTTCSGQSVHQQAPYSCSATKIIDGTTFTSHLSETASGHLSVSIDLAAPRSIPTLIHMTSHEGNSGAGLAQTDPNKVIPAGSTHGVLTIAHALCGQIDVKVVYTRTGNGNGRMSGAYVENDTCKEVTPPTSTPPSTTPISPPATNIRQHPPTSTPGSPGGPSTPSVSIPHRNTLGGNLPATGGSIIENPLFWAGLALFLFGGVGIVFGRRRATS